ncbi:acyltransferase [Congregibacter variabilis]|uniref:Acyltransferase n=1 Tax=Congregibacter variabilis TaxID=3081200 RepID=A0ABZ0I7B2_9GAMM|nr:acyltransferase [Congregibacter sp. IMCC43200]
MKTTLKSSLQIVALAIALPLALIERLLRRLGDMQAFAGCSHFLSLLPGRTGSYLRVGFYRLTLDRCAADMYIGFGSIFSQQQTTLASGVYIGPQCNIGACSIGQDTLVASGVHILSGAAQHRYDDLNVPIRDQNGTFSPVNIGKDCWIGNGSLILADVGDHAIVGAGSVVTRTVPAYAIVAGNPARVIKSRLDNSNKEPIKREASEG